MVITTRIDLLIPVLSDSGWDRDPTSEAQQEPLSEKASSQLREELCAESVNGSEDEGWDPPEDDPINSRRHYANSVGMRLWEKI